MFPFKFYQLLQTRQFRLFVGIFQDIAFGDLEGSLTFLVVKVLYNKNPPAALSVGAHNFFVLVTEPTEGLRKRWR